MLKKILNNKTDIVIGLFLIGLLIAIRAFENNLFYDPFLTYFKLNYTNLALPIVNPVKLFLSLGFRYYLNSMISLGMLFLLFKDIKIIKFSVFLYVLFGTVLMISFFFMLYQMNEPNKMYLFYIRRFLIQPIFLILFVPAFYYQKKIK
jgi:exosortase F-associated protein